MKIEIIIELHAVGHLQGSAQSIKNQHFKHQVCLAGLYIPLYVL